MKIYELTYIISPELSTTDAEALKQDIESFIKNKEGLVLKSDKMTMQTLAYPVKKQRSGYFAIAEAQMEESVVLALKEMLEKHSKVLRNLIVIKKPSKPMKERRTRRPMGTVDSKVSPVEEKKKGEKVEMEEMEKKLDEILSE